MVGHVAAREEAEAQREGERSVRSPRSPATAASCKGQLPQEEERGTVHVPASTPAPKRTAKDNSFGGGGAFKMSPEEEDLLLQALLEYEAGTKGKTEKD